MFRENCNNEKKKKFFYIQISGEMLAMLPRIVWFPNLSIEQYFFWYEVDVLTSWGCTGPSSAQAGI